MIRKQISTATSALPGRPERPFVYVWPVTAPDGSVGYDHPLENYFDANMAPRLIPSQPTSRLYDTVARAHDHRFQVTTDMLDPSCANPRPLLSSQRERCRSLANLPGNSPNYMGILPDVPGWRPRRSSYEDRRGSVGVTPSEVNTLVPYIPPIDTSLPSREWLDEMARRFLARAQADLEASSRDAASNVTGSRVTELRAEESRLPLAAQDSFFDYDTDSTLDGPVSVPHLVPQLPPPQQPESESNSTDTDMDYDTDTDTDVNSDDDYDWNNPPKFHFSEAESKWLIPRKRPSVVIVDGKDVTMTIDPPPNKRRRGRKTPKARAAKRPRRCKNDTLAQPPAESASLHHVSESEVETPPSSFGPSTPSTSYAPLSAVTATALQIKHVRIASPCVSSPPLLPQPTSPPRSPKLFPCRLNGCSQICTSAGDLQRHQQSLRHRAPSHVCLACGKSYTRPDALKRHLNSKVMCKKEHATKLANEMDLDQELAEADAEAV